MTKLVFTPEHINRLTYQLVYDIHQILEARGVKYWVDGDTLMGAVRHNGIIPWENEIDIGISSTDNRKFSDLGMDFANCGYSITDTFFGYKVFYTNRAPVEVGAHHSTPFVNVLLYRTIDNRLRLSRKKAREAWSHAMWRATDLFPLKRYTFGDFHVYGAAHPGAYITSNYGRDWEKIAFVPSGERGIEVETNLTPRMRKAAQPTGVRQRRCVRVCLVRAGREDVSSLTKSATVGCSHSGGCFRNFDVPMGVYVINCKVHKSRYEKFKRAAEKANVVACRVPCVSGAKLTQKLVCEMRRKKQLSANASMSAVEVAINLSHFNCWQRIVDSCLDYGMVLEDDVEMSEDFADKIDAIMASLREKSVPFSILHLWNGNWAQTAGAHKTIATVDGMRVVQETKMYNAGAAAYIISKEYARWLLDRTFPISEPQDMRMGTYVRHGNHLSLKMRYDRGGRCYVSPLIEMECGGDGGTGVSTQDYEAKAVKTSNCMPCRTR